MKYIVAKTLLEFIKENPIDNTMLWKESAKNQFRFVGGTLVELFYNYKDIKNPYEAILVPSSHTSKSIILPVYRIETLDLLIYMRENFYGWVVTIQSKTGLPLKLDTGLMPKTNETITPCYAEGFDESWVLPAYTEGCTGCTFRVCDDYKLYTLFWNLLQYIKSQK